MDSLPYNSCVESRTKTLLFIAQVRFLVAKNYGLRKSFFVGLKVSKEVFGFISNNKKTNPYLQPSTGVCFNRGHCVHVRKLKICSCLITIDLLYHLEVVWCSSFVNRSNYCPLLRDRDSLWVATSSKLKNILSKY